MIKVLNGCPIAFDSLGTPDGVAAAVEKALQAWRETELALGKRTDQYSELHRELTHVTAENLRLTRELADMQRSKELFEGSSNDYKARYQREAIRSGTYREALELVIETVKS
jgi:chromosome segregation ATPase